MVHTSTDELSELTGVGMPLPPAPTDPFALLNFTSLMPNNTFSPAFALPPPAPAVPDTTSLLQQLVNSKDGQLQQAQQLIAFQSAQISNSPQNGMLFPSSPALTAAPPSSSSSQHLPPLSSTRKASSREFPVPTDESRAPFLEELEGYTRPELSEDQIDAVGAGYYNKSLPLSHNVRDLDGEALDAAAWSGATDRRLLYIPAILDLRKDWSKQVPADVELAMQLAELDVPELSYCPASDGTGASSTAKGAHWARHFIKIGFDELKRNPRERSTKPKVKKEEEEGSASLGVTPSHRPSGQKRLSELPSSAGKSSTTAPSSPVRKKRQTSPLLPTSSPGQNDKLDNNFDYIHSSSNPFPSSSAPAPSSQVSGDAAVYPVDHQTTATTALKPKYSRPPLALLPQGPSSSNSTEAEKLRALEGQLGTECPPSEKDLQRARRLAATADQATAARAKGSATRTAPVQLDLALLSEYKTAVCDSDLPKDLNKPRLSALCKAAGVPFTGTASVLRKRILKAIEKHRNDIPTPNEERPQPRSRR